MSKAPLSTIAVAYTITASVAWEEPDLTGGLMVCKAHRDMVCLRFEQLLPV